MRKTGKGIPLSINAPNKGGTSTINSFKMLMEAASEGLPVREFRPLKGYVLPREDERKRYASLPSQYV